MIIIKYFISIDYCAVAITYAIYFYVLSITEPSRAA